MYRFISMYGKKLALGSTAIVPMSFFISNVVAMDANCATPPHYHMVWEDWFKCHDTAGLRRGYQVYKEVCSSCHPVRFICYRHLVGRVFTEKQAKIEASQAMIEDGPNDEGDLILRPGLITDVLPPPYKNDMAARSANNGAVPPDLSLIVGARHHGAPYLFSLLTGFGHEIPPGQVLEKGQHFNPFYPGGAISMAPPLADGAVEFPDGTPATVSQMAKDVTQFFAWAYWRHMDRGKQIGMCSLMWVAWAFFFTFWLKKFVYSTVSTQRVTYKMKPFA